MQTMTSLLTINLSKSAKTKARETFTSQRVRSSIQFKMGGAIQFLTKNLIMCSSRNSRKTASNSRIKGPPWPLSCHGWLVPSEGRLCRKSKATNQINISVSWTGTTDPVTQEVHRTPHSLTTPSNWAPTITNSHLRYQSWKRNLALKASSKRTISIRFRTSKSMERAKC